VVPAASLARVVRAPAWVALARDPPAVAPCTPRVLRLAVLADPASALAWVRVQDLAHALDLASVPEWVALDWLRRLPVKPRVRLVPVREAVAVRVTRRPKKDR